MSRNRFFALAAAAVTAAVLLFASAAEAGPRGGGNRGGGNRGGGYYGGNRGYYGGGYYGGGYYGGGIGAYPGTYYDYPYGYSAPSYVVPAAPSYGSMPAAASADYAPRADASDLTVHVTVRAPADAEIWFGGTKTRQTGAVREFESPELMSGRKYTYEVRARWTQDGKEVSRTRSIEVTAGARKTVDFTKSAE